MKKVLALVATACVPAFALSACNGSSNGATGVSALPNSQGAAFHARPHDVSVNDLDAGGATFPAQAYNGASQPVGVATGTRAASAAGSLFASVKLASSSHIYYCLTGSGTGVGIFTSGSKGQSDGSTATTKGACAPLGATPTGFGARNDPPDFAGSDVALASTDYTAYKTTREPSVGTSWGEPFEAPVIGGPIVYAYRPISGFPTVSKRIHMSKWTYCAIANGTISNWNDAAITKDNGKSVTGKVSRPITFVFRSDGSGTSFNFTFHLNAVCQGPWNAPYNAAPYESAGHSADWTFGPANKNWPGPGSTGHPNPNFIGESGNPGVLAEVQSAQYSVGYVEGAYAASASPAVAQSILQSSASGGTPIWSDPTSKTDTNASLSILNANSITFGQGSDGLPLGTSAPKCALYINPAIFTNPVANGAPTYAYPINAVSYLLFYGKNNSVHLTQKLQLIKYMTGSAARTIEKNEEYTPLPTGITSAVSSAAATCVK
jgi:ABC-type phosphate transport system substrate-binding protein